MFCWKTKCWKLSKFDSFCQQQIYTHTHTHKNFFFKAIEFGKGRQHCSWTYVKPNDLKPSILVEFWYRGEGRREAMNIWQEYYMRQIKVNNASNYQSLKLTFVGVKLARVSLLINVPSHGNRSNGSVLPSFLGHFIFYFVGSWNFSPVETSKRFWDWKQTKRIPDFLWLSFYNNP